MSFNIWLYHLTKISVHIMINMENRPGDPDNIQGCHRPVSLIRIKYITRANDFFFVLCNYGILAKHSCTTEIAQLTSIMQTVVLTADLLSFFLVFALFWHPHDIIRKHKPPRRIFHYRGSFLPLQWLKSSLVYQTYLFSVIVYIIVQLFVKYQQTVECLG